MYHQRPTLATIFRIDSSLEGEGNGSERRSPRDKSVSLEDVLLWAFAWAPIDELEGCDSAVEEVAVTANVEGFEDDVDEDEADDLTITPATGIRTIQRRRLSNPCRPRRRCMLSLEGLRLILESVR